MRPRTTVVSTGSASSRRGSKNGRSSRFRGTGMWIQSIRLASPFEISTQVPRSCGSHWCLCSEIPIAKVISEVDALRRRGRHPRLLHVPELALAQAQVDQPAGALQQRSRPAHRRRRDLPRRPQPDPPRRDALHRTKRRVVVGPVDLSRPGRTRRSHRHEPPRVRWRRLLLG